MSEESFEPELGQALFGQPTKEYQVAWELQSGLEMIRHYLNIAFDLEGDPFGNSGADFKCSVFEVESYSWNEDVEQPYNFKWRDLEVSWYKYFGRGMSVNRAPKVREIIEMVHECLDVLRQCHLHAVTRITELEAAQRWIPVSERLPEEGELVFAIVYDANDDSKKMSQLKYYGGGKWFSWDSECYVVTHWMPLPQPPEVQQ